MWNLKLMLLGAITENTPDSRKASDNTDESEKNWHMEVNKIKKLQNIGNDSGNFHQLGSDRGLISRIYNELKKLKLQKQ